MIKKMKLSNIAPILMFYTIIGLIITSIEETNLILSWTYIIGGLIIFTLIFKSNKKTKKELHESEV